MKDTLPHIFQNLTVTEAMGRDDSDILIHLMQVASPNLSLRLRAKRISKLDANSIFFYNLATHLFGAFSVTCLL